MGVLLEEELKFLKEYYFHLIKISDQLKTIHFSSAHYSGVNAIDFQTFYEFLRTTQDSVLGMRKNKLLPYEYVRSLTASQYQYQNNNVNSTLEITSEVATDLWVLMVNSWGVIRDRAGCEITDNCHSLDEFLQFACNKSTPDIDAKINEICDSLAKSLVIWRDNVNESGLSLEKIYSGLEYEWSLLWKEHADLLRKNEAFHTDSKIANSEMLSGDKADGQRPISRREKGSSYPKDPIKLDLYWFRAWAEKIDTMLEPDWQGKQWEPSHYDWMLIRPDEFARDAMLRFSVSHSEVIGQVREFQHGMEACYTEYCELNPLPICDKCGATLEEENDQLHCSDCGFQKPKPDIPSHKIETATRSYEESLLSLSRVIKVTANAVEANLFKATEPDTKKQLANQVSSLSNVSKDSSEDCGLNLNNFTGRPFQLIKVLDLSKDNIFVATSGSLSKILEFTVHREEVEGLIKSLQTEGNKQLKNANSVFKISRKKLGSNEEYRLSLIKES